MKNPFKRAPDSNPYEYRGAPGPSRSFLGSNKLKILVGVVVFIIIVIYNKYDDKQEKDPNYCDSIP
jgi:hypothetical protein